ncbi:MAG: DUF2182 domain-containing protein [Alphaproteobacteria bacterium]
MAAQAERRRFLALIGALVVLSWAALAIWEQSPYGRFLDHGRWTEIGLAASICRAIPAGDVVVPALIYAGGWLLMLTAMMLPTTLPLLDIFGRITAGRRDRRLLISLVIAGYLAVWGLFGVLSHVVDMLLHELARQSIWLSVNAWIVGAIVLAIAGLFQFSALKYRCLDKCRTPLSFVIEHWRGSRERRQAWLLGVHHGVFCVGCCWAIMLLMFVVGSGNVGWMLALGAVMAVEKNMPWGRRLTAPLGAALLAAAIGVTALEL